MPNRKGWAGGTMWLADECEEVRGAASDYLLRANDTLF